MPKAQVQVETSEQEAIDALIGAGLANVESRVVEFRSPTVTELSEVHSFEDAIRLATEVYGEIIPSFDLGDGFVGIDKEELVGVPFLVMGWGLGWSDYGVNERFSILRVVTRNNDKYRIIDGGSGIHRTMMDKFGGDPANFRALMALGGLSKGEYTPRDADGEPLKDGKGTPILKATTYRIDVETLSVKS
jgi:hypothetical protein